MRTSHGRTDSHGEANSSLFANFQTRLNTPGLGIFSLLCFVNKIIFTLNKIVFTGETKNNNNKLKSDFSFSR
jgi:hypothetical protein